MRRWELKILDELSVSKKTVWELLDSIDFPLRDFFAIIGNLIREGLIGADGEGLYLTEKGLREIGGTLRPCVDICPRCLGKGIVFDGDLKRLVEEFRGIVKDRPTPALEYFQGYTLEEEVIARIALMSLHEDLRDRRFILIGDDDLLSIALSLTGLPSRITVLDIDERLGSFITGVAARHGLDIEFRRYNVADPLPEDLVGEFDVFSSEPLETFSGLRAFIARGVACLREEGAGYVGLTYLEASPRKWFMAQRLLSRMNCVLTDVIRGFSIYPMNYGGVNYEAFIHKLMEGLGVTIRENEGINWYKSTLYRFEVLGRPRLIVPPDKRLRVRFIDPVEDITQVRLRRGKTYPHGGVST
ncbi:MAG: bis-aminopropyl spermidine synthase family protein [Candidatus Bathyarchaeia archaeon]